MPAKIVVKAYRGGSKVTLLGSSGKELLSSSVFTEPRAKGATLRALKGLLGDDIVIEDHTRPVKGAPTKEISAPAVAAAAAKVVSSSTKAVAEKVATKAGVKTAPRRSTRPTAKKAARK